MAGIESGSEDTGRRTLGNAGQMTGPPTQRQPTDDDVNNPEQKLASLVPVPMGYEGYHQKQVDEKVYQSNVMPPIVQR